MTNPFEMVPGKLDYMSVAQQEALSRMTYAIETKSPGRINR